MDEILNQIPLNKSEEINEKISRITNLNEAMDKYQNIRKNNEKKWDEIQKKILAK